jgi:hypothetical protein
LRATTSSVDEDQELLDFEKIATVPGQGTIAEATDYEYVDEAIIGGIRYVYRIADVSYKGVITYHENISVFVELPKTYELFQNYPNPFNPSTTIKYNLPENAQVGLKVFNVLGQEVASLVNEIEEAGFHQVQWNGINQFGHPVAGGVYFIYFLATSQVEAKQFTRVMKVILLK